MDPLTHAIVGGAVAAVSGADVSLTSPELIATTLGAISPDLDIIYQYWGDYVYLKHHRGYSHSLPGLLGFAALIGGAMSFFTEVGFLTLFAWALLGALSHTLLDLFNSYGVMLFYPFSRKKYTLNLLMISDPFLISCSLAILFFSYKNKAFWVWPAVVACIVYLFLRLLMRRRAEALVRQYYEPHLDKLVVMPAFIGLVKWDFIVRVNKKNIVGQINLLSCKIKIHKKLKLISEEVKEILEKTKIGNIFKEFTPFFHIHYQEDGNKLIGKFIDLRYYVRNNFLHHGTVIVNKKTYQVEKALFQPYSLTNKIEIN